MTVDVMCVAEGALGTHAEWQLTYALLTEAASKSNVGMADEQQLMDGSQLAAPPSNLPFNLCGIDLLLWIVCCRARSGNRLLTAMCAAWRALTAEGDQLPSLK